MKSALRRLSKTIADSPVIAAMLTIAVAAAAAVLTPPVQAKEATMSKPTILLVHGAFAESASWNGVMKRLLAKGYPVVAVANPLRSVKGDAGYLDSVVESVNGPVILVGHSYGGNVISNATTASGKIKALVYVAGVAPEPGESASSLGAKFPTGTLGPSLAPPVPLADGSKDLYIQLDKYPNQFAADVPVAEAKLMAAAQRPVTEAALNDPSVTAAWKTIPSWFIYGSLDKNIPAALHAFMAKRAGARKTIAVEGASHVVMISHPDAVAKLIEEAAAESTN
ncbi:MAG: alpha/beta hydrolase [Caldimonas sp.]